MRFERLHIPAFGPFTNLDLHFPAQGGDLHVIFGSNEAGKSSLLRAFRDLLFGIPGQSSDNFVHDYRKLRITGEIVSRAGERLSFQRRKGNRTLCWTRMVMNCQTKPSVLFLAVWIRSTFPRCLVWVRRNSAKEQNNYFVEREISGSLFSASMGGTPVQLVLASLTGESDGLFKGRATANVSIRPAVNRYKELLRKSREAVVSPEAWEKIERDLAAAEEAKANLENEISTFTRDLEWLSRCEDALPTVGRLSEEMRKLEAIPLMPEVSSDFVERARAARKAVHDAQAEVERLTSQITKLESQLADCQTTPPLLAEADALDRLHQNVGGHQERKNSLTDLEIKLAGLEAALQPGMQNLELSGNFSALETLRLTSAVRLACEEATENLQQALDERRKNIKKAEDLKTQIESLETQLQALPEVDLTDLRDAFPTAAGATEANRTLSASESEVKRLAHEVGDCHRELTGAPNDLDTTGSLSVPSKATIRRIGEEMDGIHRDIRTRSPRSLKGKSGSSPFKPSLVGWSVVENYPQSRLSPKPDSIEITAGPLCWRTGKATRATKNSFLVRTLEEAFPQAMVQADDIADQLREQAEAVAQAEEKRFQITESEKQNQGAAEQISELQRRLKGMPRLMGGGVAALRNRATIAR